MDLHQKLTRLAEKQRDIEAKIAEQAHAENHAVAQALITLIRLKPQAAAMLQHEQVVSKLAKRDAKLLTAWLTRTTGDMPLQKAEPLHADDAMVPMSPPPLGSD